MITFVSDLWTAVAPWFAINRLFAALLILSVADVVTGTLCAIRNRAVDSSISREGLMRKIGLLVLVLVCKGLEQTIMPGIPVAATVAVGLIKMEGESLLENIDQLGLHIPYLAQYFAKLNTLESKAEDKADAPAG